MKRVLLICPDQRPGLEELTSGLPLALAMFLGKPLIEHALDGLVRQGVTHVRILASDRPSDLRAYVLHGTAWGLHLEIIPEASELTPADAAVKHAAFPADRVLVLDALPQAPEIPLLTNPAAWHNGRSSLLPVLAPLQIGTREVAPGVWFGLRARADATAHLIAPCWVGPNSIIRAHATVGPHAFVESDSLVDTHATTEHSTIGPRTYLGSMMHLNRSVAAGCFLFNWRHGSLTRISDAFLLSPLVAPHDPASPLPARLLALLIMGLTTPLLIPAAALSLLRRLPLLRKKSAVLPTGAGSPRRTISYHELAALPGLFARWPELWRIATGHFAWTGNPPLTPHEADQLHGEFEQLWLHTDPGFFTAPEAEGCTAPWDDTARAHAALFASQPTTAWRWKAIRHGLTTFLL